MKKYILSLGIGLATIFIGCANNQPQTNSFSCQIEGAQAPKWVCNPEDMEGAIVAVGSAQKNAGNDFQFQKEEAMQAARDALARRISVKVKNMFKQFKSTTGTGANQTFDKVTESVSKQVASQVLNGTKQENLWISPKGTMFVEVSMPTAQVKEAVKEAVKTSYQNNKALYQKFLGKKAQEELDSAVEKEFGVAK